MTKILLVEDDKILQDSLCMNLKGEGFDVRTAGSLKEGEEIQKSFSPDLIILDWMLPDGQGIELVRTLRQAGDSSSVIILTARADVVDKVLGLELGADDYMTKPFEPRELIARIHVQMRKTTNSTEGSNYEDESIFCADISLNPVTMEVKYKGDEVQLTKMEFTLLKLLLENPNKVFSRDEILDTVWGMKYPTTRTVDMHICQLRHKFKPALFETVHGLGYRFKPEK